MEKITRQEDPAHIDCFSPEMSIGNHSCSHLPLTILLQDANLDPKITSPIIPYQCTIMHLVIKAFTTYCCNLLYSCSRKLLLAYYVIYYLGLNRISELYLLFCDLL